MKLAANMGKALSDSVGGAHRTCTEQRAQRQKLRDTAIRAQQDGATHGKRLGPAVAFHRERADRLEGSFAEYNPSTRRHHWIRQAPDWREDPLGIPGGAVQASEIVRRAI